MKRALGIALVAATLTAGVVGVVFAPSDIIDVRPENLQNQSIPIHLTYDRAGEWIVFRISAEVGPPPASGEYDPWGGRLSLPGRVHVSPRAVRSGDTLEWIFWVAPGSLRGATFSVVCSSERMPGFTSWQLDLAAFVLWQGALLPTRTRAAIAASLAALVVVAAILGIGLRRRRRKPEPAT